MEKIYYFSINKSRDNFTKFNKNMNLIQKKRPTEIAGRFKNYFK